MQNGKPAKLLRIHLSETDTVEGKPAYKAILRACHDARMEGATVFRGLEGYGESAEVHRHHLIHSDQPVLVVVIDDSAKVERLIPMIEPLLGSGTMAISDVTVVRVRKEHRAP